MRRHRLLTMAEPQMYKEGFFPAPSVCLDVCPGGCSGHLAGAGWEQTVLVAVCARHPLV